MRRWINLMSNMQIQSLFLQSLSGSQIVITICNSTGAVTVKTKAKIHSNTCINKKNVLTLSPKLCDVKSRS